MNCIVCDTELVSDKAKTCSPRCRQIAHRQVSVTKGVSVTSPEPSVTFRFTVRYNRKPGEEGYDSDVEAKRKEIRTAKYWYDIPLGAIPVTQKDWPDMPEFMNGRQYFLWWKNNFKLNGKIPEIHNPRPAHENVRYEMGGEQSRKWGA